ncbi:MAG: Hsp70 family protein [Pseudonocardiaceae bacterium]
MSIDAVSITVGIDLGTTNSAVAVHADAEVPRKQELIDSGRLRPVGKALVITDSYRSPTTPSAVWLDRSGTPLVGEMAKHKARMPGEPPPARFFKRAMGTDQVVTAGHARLTAQQAATHVLRYLKELAEEALGVPVARAVVTVPAFFEMGAKNATTQAGAAAGMEVVETLIEPVAAALTYAGERVDDVVEPSTFLVYDLGGGTFDASVVSWDPEGAFEHLSFDGDRFLGGFDFDNALVSWICEQLPAYDLNLDLDDDADQILFSRMLVDAETAKHELSRTPYTTVIMQGATDRAGVPMNINLPVQRQDFDRLIEAKVRGTLDSCDRALRHAGIDPGRLGDVVMVGGSSRIPLVVTLVEQRYGRRPLLIDPDLCVAVGAALKTAVGSRVTPNLVVDRAVAAGSTADVGGRVVAGGRIIAPENQVVVIASDDGTLRRQERSRAQGKFHFQDIPLTEGENDFTLQLILNGQVVDSQRCSVSVDEREDIHVNSHVLAHNFYVNIKGGLEQIAALGTKIPHEVRLPLRTVNQGSTLTVPVFEGRTPIGEVRIEDLPGDLPVGSTVDLDLTFTTDWMIEAEVRVPSVHKAGIATMRMDMHSVASWEELAQRYHEAAAGWHEKRALASPPVRIEYGPVIDALLGEVEDLLTERRDPVQTNHKLTEVETAVSTLPISSRTVLQPPMSVFESRLAQLAERCDELERRDGARAQEFRDGIPGLRAVGLAAYDAENQLDWGRAVDAVTERTNAIVNILVGDRPVSAPNAEDLQRRLRSEIDGAAQRVREHLVKTGERYRNEGEALLREAGRIERDVGSVDVQDPGAVRLLRSVATNQLIPWQGDVAAFLDRGDQVLVERFS